MDSSLRNKLPSPHRLAAAVLARAAAATGVRPIAFQPPSRPARYWNDPFTASTEWLARLFRRLPRAVAWNAAFRDRLKWTMRLFHWTRAKSVFMPEFDAEHRNLYQLGENLYQAWSAGASSEAMLPSVRALLAAAEDHFAHEELLMQAARYPLLNWHRRQHETARNAARPLVARSEAGDRQAVKALLELLAGWMKDHLAVADRMMAAALRAYARAGAA